MIKGCIWLTNLTCALATAVLSYRISWCCILLAFAKWNTLRKSKYTTSHKNITFKTKQRWKQVPKMTNINIICKLLNHEVWYMNLRFKQHLSYLAAQMCCACFFFLVVFFIIRTTPASLFMLKLKMELSSNKNIVTFFSYHNVAEKHFAISLNAKLQSYNGDCMIYIIRFKNCKIIQYLSVPLAH